MNDSVERLNALAIQHDFLGKGFLGVALVITDQAKMTGLPLDSEAMVADGGAQIKGVSGTRVRNILARHGIARRLTSEGGRTSRGGPAKMRRYVAFLNAERDVDGFDLDAIERYWVDGVRAYFAGQPFVLTIDPAMSVRGALQTLLVSVEARQRELTGATIMGTVIQYLVGAKIEIVLGQNEGVVSQHGASVRDQSGRHGDLELGDTVVHVTTMPTTLLVEKCAANLAAGKRPLIVTGRRRLAAADGLIEDAGLGARVDVLDYEGFLAANIFELGHSDAKGRRKAFGQIVDRYNMIIDRVEGDPSLRIDLR